MEDSLQLKGVNVPDRLLQVVLYKDDDDSLSISLSVTNTVAGIPRTNFFDFTPEQLWELAKFCANHSETRTIQVFR